MIDPNKKYRTRDGFEARIYAVDAGGTYSVHGAIKRNGVWVATAWSKEGCWSNWFSINDLVEVTPRIQREVWLNVYNGRLCTGYPSKEESDRVSLYDRIACVKVIIDCEEGEGLC